MDDSKILESGPMQPLNGRTTLVEQVVDRIVEAAARGVFLPGDRSWRRRWLAGWRSAACRCARRCGS